HARLERLEALLEHAHEVRSDRDAQRRAERVLAAAAAIQRDLGAGLGAVDLHEPDQPAQLRDAVLRACPELGRQLAAELAQEALVHVERLVEAPELLEAPRRGRGRLPARPEALRREELGERRVPLLARGELLALLVALRRLVPHPAGR